MYLLHKFQLNRSNFDCDVTVLIHGPWLVEMVEEMPGSDWSILVYTGAHFISKDAVNNYVFVTQISAQLYRFRLYALQF